MTGMPRGLVTVDIPYFLLQRYAMCSLMEKDVLSEDEALENLQLEFPDVKWPEEVFEIGENGVNLKAGAQALFECSQNQESGSSKVRVR